MSNSLGYISKRNTISYKINIENSENILEKKTEWKKPLFFLLSLSSYLLAFFMGIYFIPTEIIFRISNYNEISSLFLAMWGWFSNNIGFIFLTWILPIPFGIFIPLKYTEAPLAISAVILTSMMYISLFLPYEGENFIYFLKNTSEASYMWYDYITITTVTFITQPFSFIIIFLGPTVCVTCGEYTTNKSFLIYLLVSLLSILIIVQISQRFINDNGEFFLLGYKSKSYFATLFQSSMIIVWVRCFHLICRDCYNTFVKYDSNCYRIIAVLWVLFGTALVEIWVSSSWALHLAYTSFMVLEKEQCK